MKLKPWWKVTENGVVTEVVVLESTATEVHLQYEVANGLALRKVPRETEKHRYCSSDDEVKIYRRKCLLRKVDDLEEKRTRLVDQVRELEDKTKKLREEAQAL